jgi:hypothetical protein
VIDAVSLVDARPASEVYRGIPRSLEFPVV